MVFEYYKYEPSKDFYELYNLFRLAFPNSKHLIKNPVTYQSYLNWLYLDNPLGLPVGYNAYCEGKLVGHYACIPLNWSYENKIYRALLSLNTAVHPNFRRKGLFSELAEKTYKFAKKEGFDFVYGVSNSNSTHGFMKLGFCLVGELYLQLCVLPSFKNMQDDVDKIKLCQIQSNQFVNWRLNRPFTKYSKTGRRIVSKSKTSVVKVISKEIDINKMGMLFRQEVFPSIYFYMGSVKQKKMLSVPSIFRPATFNLIYKALSQRSQNLGTNLEDWDLDFLDFDLA